LIESFNGRLRAEFLNADEFITMRDMHERLKAWQDRATTTTVGHTDRSAT